MSNKSRTALTLLSLFLGLFGIDRFYAGSILLGVLKFLTVGGLGIWAIIDFVLAISGNMKDGSNGRKISKW